MKYVHPIQDGGRIVLKDYIFNFRRKTALISCKTMLRRSARLKNKTSDYSNASGEDLNARNDQETLENLVKMTYDFIKEKVTNDRSRPDANKEEKTPEKAEEYISISSRLTDSASDCHTLASELQPGLDVNDMYFKMGQANSKAIPSVNKNAIQFNEKQIMKKCVITPDFEKKETAPKYHISHYALKKQKRKEKAQSAGQGWYNMAAPEMTQELQRDLNILRMRSVLDPKRHYKKNTSKKLPKYFQMGTVVGGPAEFYSSRIPKRERKKTIVESLLADAEFRRYNKRKYLEIQASKQRGKKGFYRRSKRKRR